MTLVQAGKNKDVIIVTADSLRGKRQVDGSPTQIFLDAKKHYSISNSCSVLVAGSGFDMDRVSDFLERFIKGLPASGLDDVEIIAKELHRALLSEVAGEIGPPNNLIFILAGFKDMNPQLFRFDSDSSFMQVRFDTTYMSAGKEVFATSLAKAIKLTNDTSAQELESALRSIHSDTEKAFPNEVGGAMTVKTLRPPVLDI